ncbi:hypothetical protein CS022_20925 [Veronia nyctiphanis]|uniref:Helix-turn-helix domain-containing protein n=1 Tax=Veronia nyctiphanis TaxID=1278244 RepID=A0A4Q0YLA0_9GAMM|nr:hypothetical protein CS022_20925 [Veronia nyctiphanis]
MDLNPVFARRLYLMYLIDTTERPNVPHLMNITDWPRRTLQDAIKSLPQFGVSMSFVEDGKRHNDGFYQIDDWGPINKEWVHNHHIQLAQMFQPS